MENQNVNNMVKLFCYGTLQESSVQMELIGRVVSEKIVTSIEGYIVLRDYVDPEDGIAYPRIVEHERGCVYGSIIEFSDDEIVKLDAYETEMYERKLILTNCGELVQVYMPANKEIVD